MSIDKALEYLKAYDHGFTGYAGNFQEPIDVAIDILRRYQKITEIVYDKDISIDIEKINWIKEIIENGNDD